MLNPEKNPRVFFIHMYEIANRALTLTDGKEYSDYANDDSLKLALTYLLQIIGEAARNIPLDLQKMHPNIPWREIIGMRHKLAHDYMVVDERIVWQTTKTKLPELVIHLKKILDDYDK